MTTYKTKLVEVEAMQFDGSRDSARAIQRWAHEGLDDLANAIVLVDPNTNMMTVRTIAGHTIALSGDWIVRGGDGEFFLVTDDVFHQRYEA